METKKLFNEIQKIDLQKMTNAAHVQFIQNVCARVESENALQANKQIKNAAKKLVEALKEERRCLSLSRKSLTTDNIREFDHERDSLFIGFKGAVRNFQKISVPEMKQAAIELYQRIKEFGIKPRSISTTKQRSSVSSLKIAKQISPCMSPGSDCDPT